MNTKNKSLVTGPYYSDQQLVSQTQVHHPLFWLRQFNFATVQSNVHLVCQRWDGVFLMFLIADPIIQEWKREQDKYKRFNQRNLKNAGRKPFDMCIIYVCSLLQLLFGDSLLAFSKKITYNPLYLSCLYAFFGRRVETPKRSTIHKYFDFLCNDGLLGKISKAFTRYALNIVPCFIQVPHVRKEIGKTGIVDASYMDTDISHHPQEAYAAIKSGNYVSEFGGLNTFRSEAQRDESSTFSKKRSQTHYGYKVHALVDNISKLIVNTEFTEGHVHDSKMLINLCRSSFHHFNEVYADSGYIGKDFESELLKMGISLKTTSRAYRNRPLTDKEKNENKTTSSIRSRVEHTFACLDRVLKVKLRAKTMLRNCGTHLMFVIAYNALRLSLIMSGRMAIPRHLLPTVT